MGFGEIESLEGIIPGAIIGYARLKQDEFPLTIVGVGRFYGYDGTYMHLQELRRGLWKAALEPPAILELLAQLAELTSQVDQDICVKGGCTTIKLYSQTF
ncbi:MAG: hypothetical protein ABIG95_02970 [Candidatus Woesearchaeota archaeon]